ncbi:uncharacterized protein KY384_008918 [Bacidia gigantensis]|uniref:uncharacterized protein n=1 Tax=Bacidia gigantensis TaxID=2732470 RepID=UPI001D057DE7|nr:uncharacterized protein KY384_008918 [Bacidia gigantensis]KAG8525274.1 hypothetical protein KY384_008918 [Bacidia gigantensis]
MVGIPTSRGCDACRKRKKKCDAVTDACSYCRKANVPCVGYGQQRYNFRDEGPSLRRRYPGSGPLAVRITAGHQLSNTFIVTLAREPSNEIDLLSKALISKALPSVEINYHLVMNFGGFLREIPRRLGTHVALDRAACVLVAAHTDYCAGHLNPSTDTLVKYSAALRALAQCLDDPVQNSTSETLCTVMLLSICRIFIRDNESLANHFVGASHILKRRGLLRPRDEFEKQILLTLRGPMAIEAITDDRIQFTSEEWRTIATIGLDGRVIDGDVMICLAQLPNLMARARLIITQPETISNSEILGVQSELIELQKTYEPVLKRLRERWEYILRKFSGSSSQRSEQQRMVHCHYGRMFAFGLTISMLINFIRANIIIGDDAFYLVNENTRMSYQILELAESLVTYRPLGSIAMTLFLSAAAICTKDPRVKDRIEAMYSIFNQDVYGCRETSGSLAERGSWSRQEGLPCLPWTNTSMMENCVFTCTTEMNSFVSQMAMAAAR